MVRNDVVTFRPGHEAEYCFTQGRWSGPMLFLGGMAAIDDEGHILHKGDLAAQMRAIYRDIARLLARDGLTLEDIVRETIFTTDMAAWRETLPLRREIFGSMIPPPGSIVGVVELADPGMLVEIEVVARQRSVRRRLQRFVAGLRPGAAWSQPYGPVSGRL